MKKILLLILIALLLNGCRYVNTTEPYLDAQESKELTIPENVDKPNSTSTLEIPSPENTSTEKNNNPAPPDMPIRTKESDNGNLKITNRDGYPVLTVKTDMDTAWKAMNSISVEDWTTTSSEKSSCVVNLSYDDKAAKDREKDGFLKKMFRRDKYFTDHSGNFKLNCKQIGSVVEVKFTTADGSTASTFLADNVMSDLYKKFD